MAQGATIKAPHVLVKSVSEVRNFAVDFTDVLDSGELLTGTPTVTEVTSSDLTIDNKKVSTGSLTINGRSVATGAAIQFRVSGGSASTEYNIQMQCGTDASPAQTLRAVVEMYVVGDTT